MIMRPSVRKLTLTAHVTSSVGWLGALAVFMAHAIASLMSQDEQTVRALALAMNVTAWLVILPLCLASLITGLIGALGTAWGLFRHYWVLFKLLLTVLATAVLLLKLQPISALATAATTPGFSGADHVGPQASLLVHAGGGVLVLLAAVTLAIYKPQGLTRYGARQQREPVRSTAGADPAAVAGVPPWVKVVGGVMIVLALLVVAMLLGGGHGPSAHMTHG